QEALEIMKTELVAGVITDYEMPVMNGMEMIKEMRKSSRLSTVPVIMITSIKGSEPEAYANGITYWLLKPYVQNDLRNAIQTHFPKEIQGKTFKILLVDDVEMQTSIWEKLLSMPHFEFT